MQKLFAQNALLNNPHFKASTIYSSLKKSMLGFIDVGARGGVHDYVLPIAELTSVLGFEPDEEECQRMQQSANAACWGKFNVLPYALAEQPIEKTLHLLSATTNHSLLPPNPIFINRYNMHKNWTLVGSEKMHTLTLDEVLRTQLPDYVADFIKLDTQGTEYDIFLGAVETLKQTTAIVCEVAFCELYKGQKLFSEIELLLREHQFSFYGFMPVHTRSKKLLDKKKHVTVERMLYADAVFFKDPLSTPNLTLNQRQMCALFISALLLGYYDFALELAIENWAKLDKAEEHRIRAVIEEISELKPEQTKQSLQKLVADVEKNNEMTNVLVGNFVDRRRGYCDYDDVLNISPLPASYE